MKLLTPKLGLKACWPLKNNNIVTLSILIGEIIIPTKM
jgi:hypothetical protein